MMKNSASYVPDRGDLVWVDLEPHKGREQAGYRPAIVLSPKKYNHIAELMLISPITSKIKGYPFEVKIKTGQVDGVILADQTRSIDWKIRKPKYIEHAAGSVLIETQSAIELLLRG